MHHKAKICLGLGCQHTGGGETLVIDEGGVIATDPFHRVGWIRDDGIEGLVLTEVGLGQGVAQLHVELIVVHIVQEHVHPREVVSRVVDFLTKEAVLDQVVIHVLFRL